MINYISVFFTCDNNNCKHGKIKIEEKKSVYENVKSFISVKMPLIKTIDIVAEKLIIEKYGWIKKNNNHYCCQQCEKSYNEVS